MGTLGGSWVLLGSHGVTGSGLAWLATQTSVAVVALVVLRDLLRASERERVPVLAAVADPS